MKLTKENEIKLKAWLLSRESDIALGEEDFEALQDIFENLLNRMPKE
jgi:hypothetical protein